ncbi:hypothetical protein [Sporosarcina sp. P3]|uniref:hypothetical protein n=1 Tax=Sporosarcina sp. P3 TaxID=2048245 RepID=UPI001303FF6D|nr:hypothetical protein [Sporosarcina sp. P3]
MTNHIQEGISECERALTHMNNALPMAHHEAKQKMQHAVKDLEECIAKCCELLQ